MRYAASARDVVFASLTLLCIGWFFTLSLQTHFIVSCYVLGVCGLLFAAWETLRGRGLLSLAPLPVQSLLTRYSLLELSRIIWEPTALPDVLLLFLFPHSEESLRHILERLPPYWQILIQKKGVINHFPSWLKGACYPKPVERQNEDIFCGDDILGGGLEISEAPMDLDDSKYLTAQSRHGDTNIFTAYNDLRISMTPLKKRPSSSSSSLSFVSELRSGTSSTCTTASNSPNASSNSSSASSSPVISPLQSPPVFDRATRRPTSLLTYGPESGEALVRSRQALLEEKLHKHSIALGSNYSASNSYRGVPAAQSQLRELAQAALSSSGIGGLEGAKNLLKDVSSGFRSWKDIPADSTKLITKLMMRYWTKSMVNLIPGSRSKFKVGALVVIGSLVLRVLAGSPSALMRVGKRWSTQIFDLAFHAAAVWIVTELLADGGYKPTAIDQATRVLYSNRPFSAVYFRFVRHQKIVFAAGIILSWMAWLAKSQKRIYSGLQNGLPKGFSWNGV